MATGMRPIGNAGQLPQRSALAIALIGLAMACCIGLLAFAQARPMVALDNLILDRFLRFTAPETPARDTVVIDIDDVSLSAVGQWPWPRYRMAAMIERIASMKPAAVGLDILFAEPDRTSLTNIQETFKRDFNVDVAFSGVPDGLLNNDGFLGYAIGKNGVVGASYLYFDHVNKLAVPAESGLAFDGRTDLLALNAATGILLNAPEIAAQTKTSGFINNQLDDDGVLRRLPLLISHDGIIHASLSLATTMRALAIGKATIESGVDGPAIRVGSHVIPIDKAGFATLRFKGKPDLHRAISAVDVLNGNFDAADVKGKVVFIGSSAVGLNDAYNTAFDPRFPGLKVQALMADNILHDDFITTPSWAPDATLAACIVVGLMMSALFIFASSIPFVVPVSFCIACVTLLGSAVPFARAGVFVSPGAPIAVVATLFVLFFVARFAIERRRSRVWQKRLENARQVTIESMASVAETRDPETGAHIKRTQHYVKVIAEELKRAGHYKDTLTKEYIDLLFLSAPLHDIGKVGVPDHILLKPGRLTPDEFEIMKQHAEFGRKIIFSSAQRIEGDNFLLIAGEIAATHHERWDGTGYPLRLAGQDIPLSGRIMATADIYDALISRRCYKEAFTHQLATSLMREARGTIFDPIVLDAFFAIEPTIKAIAARYGDEADISLPVEVPAELVGSLANA
jgi:HD-GYP domain-containing protein (c-di-GMP phosphodiesterase class II)